MPKWQFWKKESEARPADEQGPAAVVASRARGFVPPPPRIASGTDEASGPIDPALSRLIHRQEMIQREIDQGELASAPDNPWAERAALIDEAIATIDSDLRKPVERVDAPVPHLPPNPIGIEVLQAEAPSRVRLTVEGHRFEYAEEIDWAERGTNIVRGDLLIAEGDVAALASAVALDSDGAVKLEMSLFELATDARDRALEGEQNPSAILVSDLLKPCTVCGDLALWNGVCLSCAKRNAERLELEIERKQLFDERDAILKDREATIERLPGLRKRMVETTAAIDQARDGTSSA